MSDIEKSKTALQEVMDKLEQGVKDVFTSETYAEYLKAMSRFHNYSFRNSMLIFTQNPQASLVAGYQAWQNNFERNVKKGEKSIKIIAPVPYKATEEFAKVDSTGKPVIGGDGKPVTEKREVTHAGFKAVSVFDVSQTEGKPLPEYVYNLQGDVHNYDLMFEAVKQSSPCPIILDELEGYGRDVNGCYEQENKIIFVRDRMPQAQTLKTAIHEVVHAKLHDSSRATSLPDRKTREVEAESVAYVVCQHFGLDTSDYSFGYIAGWSSDKELKELHGSLERIQAAAHEVITTVDERMQELTAEQKKEVVKQRNPEQLAAYIVSIYEQVKKADINKVAGVAALNMAVKRIAKAGGEFINTPLEKVFIDRGLLPYAYKPLCDKFNAIKTGFKAIQCTSPDAELLSFKNRLIASVRDLSAIADSYAGLKKQSAARVDIENSFLNMVTHQERSVQSVYDKYHEHMLSLGLSIDLPMDTYNRFINKNALLKANIETPAPENGDTFSIYQLKDGEDTRDYRWQSLERLEKAGLTADIKNYNLVYTAPLDVKADTLIDIHYRFNTDPPSDFKGHSLSMSDVVVTNINGDNYAHYVDSHDFAQVPEFWDSLKPPVPDIAQLVADRDARNKTSISQRLAANAVASQKDVPQDVTATRFVVQQQEKAYVIQDTVTGEFHSINGKPIKYLDAASAYENADKHNELAKKTLAEKPSITEQRDSPKKEPRKYFMTERQKEQAERMAEKWHARAEAFYSGGEGWGYDTAGFCKTVEDANRAQNNANRIYDAIGNICSGIGEWKDVEVIQAAVAGRDALDAGVKTKQDEKSLLGRLDEAKAETERRQQDNPSQPREQNNRRKIS